MKRQRNRDKNTFLLKVVSLIFGMTAWYIIINYQYQSLQFIVPVSFHDIPENTIISAPETVEITLRGKRNELKNIDSETICFHIDAKKLKKGNNKIIITKDHLFIPDHVSLLNSLPSTILVCMREKQKHT